VESTEIATLPGVVPLVWLAFSHAAEVVAVKVNGVPVLVIATFWAAEVPLSAGEANDSAAGATARVGATGAEFTTSATATVRGLLEAPAEVMVMVPLYVPATSDDGLTATAIDPGVVPLVGLAVSHAAEVDTE
jgi:hypothetical protein